MSKLAIFAFAVLIVCSIAASQNPKVPTPIVASAGQEITLSLVFPSVDKYLR